MATPLGSRAERLAAVRSLRSVKGRRERRSFAFEGTTLLREARAANFPIDELYVTQVIYDATPLVRQLDAEGIPTFIIEEAVAARISDLTTPSGMVAVAPIRLTDLEEIVQRRGTILILADVNDPANAGTLLRSAEAFGCGDVVFGRLGVDPYHPKVVRGSMGAVFRLSLSVASPDELTPAASSQRLHFLGLTTAGTSLADERWEEPVALVVGNERRGLGAWEDLCERMLAIPMAGEAESLSAGVAGSIALYEAMRSGLVKRVV
ncbi:MAG: RNA methyltransferase [Candidatus Cybelea sp.]|jgi:TrmH family RNA methyltransferase